MSSDTRAPRGTPRFSVVIPTRDRPAYVRNAIESVLLQSYPDFEIIVCDNFKDRPCKLEAESFDDRRVRYVAPPAPLAMHDNWEFAIDQAHGDFVLVLIDKTLLRTSALERLQAATQTHPADVYSWTSDNYYLTDEAAGDVSRGFLVPVRAVGEPFYVDSKAEIAARVSFRDRLGTEGAAYCYGKICFGAFSQQLITRIKARFGRVCPHISPDYTSKTLALLSTERLVDLNGSYLISLVTPVSNGMNFARSTVHARRFLAEGKFTDAQFDTLPIPGVFCSVHNICAHDWRMMHSDNMNQQLGLADLFVQVERDLDAVEEWASAAEREEIFAHLWSFFRNCPIEEQQRIVDKKRCAFEAELATIEMQLNEREAALKKREAALNEREAALKTREDVVADREVSARSLESQARAEYSKLYLDLTAKSVARHTASYVAAKLARLRQFERRHSARSNTPQPDLSPASHTVDSTIEEPKRGFPTFASTRAALEYAETDLYQHPVPILPAPDAAT